MLVLADEERWTEANAVAVVVVITTVAVVAVVMMAVIMITVPTHAPIITTQMAEIAKSKLS